ncbi:MAG: hypothetical protein EB072_22120 [Betaproteobacteria bacterium]|nr:hypothetical protein [Betaproteobacteria bacterium]
MVLRGDEDARAAHAEALGKGVVDDGAVGAKGGIRRISAGNYGGKLGQFQFHLHDIMGGAK